MFCLSGFSTFFTFLGLGLGLEGSEAGSGRKNMSKNPGILLTLDPSFQDY